MTGARAFAIMGWGFAVFGVVGTIVVRTVAPVPFLPAAFGFGPTVMVALLAMGLSWASIGAFLVIRRPKNAIGWMMVVVGAGYALSMLCTALTFAFAAEGTAEGRRLTELAGWATVLCTQAGGLAFVIGFIFPTGRAQSPRWALFLRLFWLMMLVFGLVVLLPPGPLHLFPTVQNPFGFGPDLRAGQLFSPLLTLLSLIVFPALVLSLVTRYRMADRPERLQLKWLALALMVSSIGLAVVYYRAVLTDRPADEVGLTVYGFAAALVPVAIAISILRYHLYDIDRIISNTIGYGLVSLVLVGAFIVVNLGLQGALLISITGSNPLAVAASTLLVAVSFNPLRRRIQRVVDRRFHRATYDAERTVAGLAGRLRDEVDIARLRQEILDVVDRSFEPTDVHLWLRPRPVR